MTTSLLSLIPPALSLLRRSSLFAMLTRYHLELPNLRSSHGFASCTRYGSLFITKLNSSTSYLRLVPSRRGCMLVPHAQASGSARTVWDEAADAYFGSEGGEAKENVSFDRRENVGNSSEARVKSRSYGSRGGGDDRGSRDRERGAYRSSTRSPERDSGNLQTRRRGFNNASPAERGGSMNSGEGRLGGARERGNWVSKPVADRRNWGTPERSVSKEWGNNNPRKEQRGGVNGYRNDRRGGLGAARRVGNEDSDDEGEEEADDYAAYRARETERVNWRLEGEPVYGVAPIRAAFLANRREFHALYVQENLAENVAVGKRKDKQAVNWVLNRAHNTEINVKVVSKHDLNLLVDNRPHQGLVLDASPLELVPLQYLESPVIQEGKAPVWVALDEVIDPQNFGAILRSAQYLGASGVVVCAKNSAPLSGVVSKASSGALEVMEVQACRNMMKFLDVSVQNGWRAVGASSEPRALPIRELLPGLPTILVLGNEGRGLRTNVKRSCTELVCIGGRMPENLVQEHRVVETDKLDSVEGVGVENEVQLGGSELQAASGTIDSLNVSVAAGILLHELLAHSVQPSIEASVQ